MKPNPKNFEPFIDPEGGQWIRIKQGKFKDTVWRPADMKVEDHPNNTEDGMVTFQAEFLGEPPSDIAMFEKVSSEIIKDIILGMVNENSDSNTSKN
jgi:hypothetical protein